MGTALVILAAVLVVLTTSLYMHPALVQADSAAYLGTTSGLEIEKRIAGGDTVAAEVFEAMSYQIAKEIGACAAVLEGLVDAIALTGSLAYSKTLTESLIPKISFIAKVYLDPGENEMNALAVGVMRFFEGKEELANY